MSLQREITPRVDIEAKNLARYKGALRVAIRNYTRRILAYIEASEKIPEASGYLKSSATEIIGKSKTDSRGDFEVWYGFGADYAKYVELGRPPGKFPPISEIEVWCMTLGIPTEAAIKIAWKIYKKGIAPQAFFEEGVRHAKNILKQELDRAFAQFKLTATVTIT